MTPYQSFLIAPFNVGLDTDQERWLLPQDAFKEMKNAHIHHGVIEKREGFKEWAEMVKTTTDLQISGITEANPGVVTVTSAASLSNGQRIQLNYVGGMTEVNGTEFLVSAVGGTTFALQDTTGTNVDTSGFTTYTSGGSVTTFPGNRIMGIHQWVDGSNNKEVLVFDTTSAAIYNTANNSLEALDTSDIFTSSSVDFVTASDWASTQGTNFSTLNRLYFTNGISNAGGSTDGIRFYQAGTGSPPTTTQYNPQINSSAEIRGAKLIFALRQRLIILHTFEGANTYPQRARWCQVQNPDDDKAWDDNKPGRGGFVDAPTGDQIVSAQYLKNSLVVFFTSSVWLLTPVSDPALPFRWQKLNSWRATEGRIGSVGYDRYVFSIGIRGICSTDGTDTVRIDERIEDFVKDEINQSEFNKVFSKRSFGNKRLWWLYPSKEVTDSDSALIYDGESKAYSTYDIALNVLGDGGVALDYAFDDFPSSSTSTNPNDLPLQFDSDGIKGMTWQDYHWDEGAELLLGGDFSGVVHTMEFGTTDNGTSIPFELSSAAWNPWIKEGKKCQFGYVDIFIDSDRDMLLDVELFKDNQPIPYITKTIDLLPDIRQIGPIVGVTIKDTPTDGVTVNSPNNGIEAGVEIYIYGILGMIELNGGPYTITIVDGDNFDISIDATGFTAYSSNGIITELPYSGDKIWKRIYSGATGYQHFINIKSQEMDSPIRIHALMPWFRPTGSRII